MANGKTNQIFIRVSDELKTRVLIQCARLGLTQTGFVKMAFVKFLEEEEQIQILRAKRL